MIKKINCCAALFLCLPLLAHQEGPASRVQEKQDVIVLQIDFVKVQSPRLIEESNLTELKAPPFNNDQQQKLLAEVNLVWEQCGLKFEVATSREVKLKTLSELVADQALKDETKKNILKRIGRYSQAPANNARTREAFDYYADAEAQALHLAKLLTLGKNSIPVLVVPNSMKVFPDSNVGHTFGVVDDDFMRTLFDGAVPTDPKIRQIVQTVAIDFGYEMTHREFISQGAKSFSCPENKQGPGSYYNVLAHEIGHFLGLNHTVEPFNLMKRDSNLLTSEQCQAARQAAEKKKNKE